MNSSCYNVKTSATVRKRTNKQSNNVKETMENPEESLLLHEDEEIIEVIDLNDTEHTAGNVCMVYDT